MKRFNYFIALILLSGCTHAPELITEQEKTVSEEEVRESNPEALKHFMDAQLYISQNNYPMAIIELQDALRLDPKAGSIHVSLSESFWKLGKIKRAEEHLLSALELNARDTEARKMLANQYILIHQYDDAEKQFLLMRQYEPENAEHIISQAELSAARRQWSKAIRLYREAYEVDKSLIPALEKAAEICIRSNQLQTAKEVYEQLVNIDDSNVEYLSAYADLLLMEERYDDAKIIIEQIMNVEGKSKDRLFQSGVIFYQKKQFQQALSFFRQALQLDDNDENIYHFISTTFLELEQFDSSAVYAEKLIELYPDDVRGFLDFALNALNADQYDDAIETLLPVADIFNSEFSVQYLLGNAYHQQKLFEEALVFLNRALVINPKSRNVQHILAIINDSMQQWSESDSLYERLISSDSTDAQAFNNYAYSLVERNERLDYAFQYANKAIELAPKNPAYMDTYGWILFKLGNVDEALNYIQHSVELEDSNAVVLEHLGDVLMKANRKDDALEYYKKAYEFNSNNEHLKAKAFP